MMDERSLRSRVQATIFALSCKPMAIRVNETMRVVEKCGWCSWNRPLRWLAIVLAALPLATTRATVEKGEKATADPLIEKLQQAAGSTINVELKTGESILRAQLLRVNVDRNKGLIVALRIQDAAGGEPRTLRFSAIRSLALDRENVYEAAAGSAKKPVEKQVQKRVEQLAEERRQWVERAKKRGVEPWPELSNEQHRSAVEEHMKMIKRVGQAIPDVDLYETHEFLFCSNIPADQVTQYTTSLDALHDMMCEMFGIKRGEPVWKGKCLVLAFRNKAECALVDQHFLQTPPIPTAYGVCHSYGDGRVIISCYRGDRPEEFAKMLVHETSHGFIHRYRTPARLPSWVNEGMAESIGRVLVPQSKSVAQREQRALQLMQQSHSVGGDFLTRKGNIDAAQYGIASSLTDFLLRSNAGGYTRFIQGMKEGQTWEESLQATFNCTADQLVTSYGVAIGVPDLHR
jgi:hypothetical protein